MKKKIKIFLGSSIVEFKNERQEIENFIYRLSDDFEDRYDISVKPLLCENFDEAYSEIRKQEEYNEKVRSSDLCFFIFFTKAGEYTREEFEVARKKFAESGKPKIYTYFKVLGDEKAEESLQDFMDELDKVFGHYYGTFDHIDTIKLRILLNLKLQEMDFLEIKVEDDGCIVDGKKAISLEKISEFANNSVFKELKAELEEVEVKYFSLKAKYKENTCTESEEREYIEIATKRQNLIDAIEELRKNIFNMSLRMCQDEARGEITLRQKEAYKLFEAGDLEGANRILDFDEIKNEYQRRKAIREVEQKNDAQIFIRESKTKIDILTMMNSLSSRFEEIEEIYDEITGVAFEENVETNVVLDFVRFLYEQNKYQKAYDVAKKLENFILNDADDEQKANICFFVGTICSDLSSKKDEAEDYYLKTIEIRERLAEENPERFKSALAQSYNNTGVFYKNQGQQEKAEEYYLKAIAIREKLAEENPERFNPALARSYNNAGIFYKDQGQPENAEDYYLRSISIIEKLSDENPEKYNCTLASIFENAGSFYSEQGQYRKAEEYYLKAIVIRERLAEENAERFNPVLADSYNNAGNFYSEQGQYRKAEEYYLKAIVIRERLAEENAERFNQELAQSYNNAGLFYKEQGQYRKAEEYYLKAIVIRERLAEENAERFNPVLADSYNNAGSFYSEQGQFGKAAGYYLKAIEIYEKIAEENPEKFNPALARSYNNAGIFYKDQGQSRKAEEYYLKAIAIREKLAKENPKRFNPDLATSYNSVGNFYNVQCQQEKAEEYYLKAIAIREKLADENPERFYPDLAVSYNNAGVFYKNQGQQEKVEEYYLKAIAIREKLTEENPERFNPDLATSYYNYAIFLNDDNYYQKTLELAKTCPEHPKCKEIISRLTK